MHVRTERFSLGEFYDCDIDALVRECSRPQMMRYLYLPQPYTTESAHDFIHNFVPQSYKSGSEVTWAIRALTSGDTPGELLGCVTIRKSGSLGFWVAENARGQGVIGEVLQYLIEYCRKALQSDPNATLGNMPIPHTLEHDAMNCNIGSCKVAHKLGFRWDFNREIPQSTTRGDSHRTIARDYFAQWSLFQNVSHLSLVDGNSSPKASTSENTSNNAHLWPALIKYTGRYAMELEKFYDGVTSLITGNLAEHSKMTEDLLKNIPLNAKYRSSAPANNIRHMTPLTQRVLLEMAQIPLGETLTYSELAQRSGAPKAVRAVATICKHNPFPLFIPCHRVVPSNYAKTGNIGKYALGIAAKKHVLELERK